MHRRTDGPREEESGSERDRRGVGGVSWSFPGTTEGRLGTPEEVLPLHRTGLTLNGGESDSRSVVERAVQDREEPRVGP